MENIKTRSTQFDPLNNFFFYKIFGEKGDEIQLLGFINAVLGKTENDKFVSVDILENKSFIADFLGGKSCVLDVRARLQNGTMVNIEVQLRNQYNIDRRSLFYFSKEYTSELEAGDDYIELPNVISINIIDYDFPKTKDFHSCFRLREDSERDIILTDALEIHFINMVKYRKQSKNKQGLDNPLCRWLVWFNKKSSPEILEEVVKMDAAIMNADTRMTSLTKDQEAMDTYRRMQMAEYDRRAEIRYAEDKRDKKIARNLLAEGLTPELIQKTTGLSLEEIAKL